MKKLFCLLVLSLLWINFVFAGETYTIDFSKQDQYLIGLKEGDRVEFDLKNEENTIILTKVRESSVEIKAYIALNTKNVPYYSDLEQGNKFVIDVDNDGINDVEVRLYRIEGEIAALFINKMEGDLWPAGYVVLDEESLSLRNNRFYDVFVVVFFILLGVLIVTFTVKKYKSKKEVKAIIKNNEKPNNNLDSDEVEKFI